MFFFSFQGTEVSVCRRWSRGRLGLLAASTSSSSSILRGCERPSASSHHPHFCRKLICQRQFFKALFLRRPLAIYHCYDLSKNPLYIQYTSSALRLLTSRGRLSSTYSCKIRCVRSRYLHGRLIKNKTTRRFPSRHLKLLYHEVLYCTAKIPVFEIRSHIGEGGCPSPSAQKPIPSPKAKNQGPSKKIGRKKGEN